MAILFRRQPEDPARADNSRRVAELIRTRLSLGDDDAVTVSEIACGDPECGGAETFALVMRAGRKTEAIKFKKPMASVTEDDVRTELEGQGAGRP